MVHQPYGEQVLFSEPASWEAIGDPGRDSRFEDICKVLKQKYGDRVRDLDPVWNSEMWLFGDKLSGSFLQFCVVKDVFGPRKE